ncbi:GrpB family protein [Glaciihabitans arcticus]|uniref:GrpB family protein n=1 Tax=Glaciihabitans arcticus TaxID=2668039 RepID=UPI0026D47342
MFVPHKQRIRAALPLALIEHIGSTSVPGLPAKPIIDIVVGVDDVTAEEDYLVPLLAAGYLLRVREPGHRLVRTPELDVLVHVYQRDDSAVRNYLLFRDRLRASASDRELYATTKRRLIAQGFDDMNAYSDAKTEAIAAIMARARGESGK